MKEYKKVFSSFTLKIIAFVTMTFDHIAAMMEAFGKGNTVVITIFHDIGRIAFPLICFLLAIGMRKTSNKHKYLARIFILGMSLTILEIIAVNVFPNGIGFILRMENNPLLDLMAASFMLYGLTYLKKGNGKKVFLSLLSLLPITYFILSAIFTYLDYQSYLGGVSAYQAYAASPYFIPYYLRAGYGILGMLLCLGFYYVEPIVDAFAKKNCKALEINFEAYRATSDYQHANNLLSMVILLVVIVSLWGISYLGIDSNGNRTLNYANMSIETFGLIALPFLYFYNGKKGYSSKAWKIIEYLYFPVHLAIIYLVFSLL